MLTAIANGDKNVEADGVNYTVENEGSAAMIHTADGADYAYVSDMSMNPVSSGIVLTPAFKEAAEAAMTAGENSFEYTDEQGETDTYLIKDKTVSIRFSAIRRRVSSTVMRHHLQSICAERMATEWIFWRV